MESIRKYKTRLQFQFSTESDDCKEFFAQTDNVQRILLFRKIFSCPEPVIIEQLEVSPLSPSNSADVQIVYSGKKNDNVAFYHSLADMKTNNITILAIGLVYMLQVT